MSELPRIDEPFNPGCPLSYYDLAEIGAAVLNSINTTLVLGHDHPGNTLDYTSAEDDAPGLVRDFVAWTSNRQKHREGARARLETYLRWIDWQRVALEAVAEAAS